MATILVVDDSAVSRHLLGYTLRRAGHTVLAVAGGREALELLAVQVVDLVIADLQMPEMDGITLLNNIRANEGTRRVRQLMLTASGQEQDRLAAEAAGTDGFLTKPASSHDLIAAVDRLLGMVQQLQTSPPSPDPPAPRSR
ncbi:MAG: response regulator [Chloroflexales bacterium]